MSINGIALVCLALGTYVVGSACQLSHRMRTESEGEHAICRLCYDKAVEVWTSSSDLYSGRFGYAPKLHIYQEHQCSDCRTTAVIYTADGRWMIKCPLCAPEGVPCDRCLPSEGVKE